MGAVESDSVKSARKAKGKLHKACERVSETRERTLHGQEQNTIMRESRDSDRFQVNTQVQSHALLRQGFGTSVPFILSITHSFYHCLTSTFIYSNTAVVSLQHCLKLLFNLDKMGHMNFLFDKWV